jgi:hypothetical protein
MTKKLKKEAEISLAKLEDKELLIKELKKLAHAGTKEAVAKIEKYLETEKDAERRAYGEMALEECEFFLYEPRNEKEEKELMLCELIKRRERRVDDLTIKIDGAEMRLEKLALEKKVHKKVLESNKSKQEDWQYFWLEDFVGMEKNELQKIEDELAYEEAWIEQAKKMITTERYKKIPFRFLGHFDFGFDEDFPEDDEDACDCGCCESEEEFKF